MKIKNKWLIPTEPGPVIPIETISRVPILVVTAEDLRYAYASESLKVPAHKKPRMWQCPKTKLWHCQRNFVRGTGTTKRYAWDQMWAKLRSE